MGGGGGRGRQGRRKEDKKMEVEVEVKVEMEVEIGVEVKVDKVDEEEENKQDQGKSQVFYNLNIGFYKFEIRNINCKTRGGVPDFARNPYIYCQNLVPPTHHKKTKN